MVIADSLPEAGLSPTEFDHCLQTCKGQIVLVCCALPKGENDAELRLPESEEPPRQLIFLRVLDHPSSPPRRNELAPDFPQPLKARDLA